MKEEQDFKGESWTICQTASECKLWTRERQPHSEEQLRSSKVGGEGLNDAEQNKKVKAGGEGKDGIPQRNQKIDLGRRGGIGRHQHHDPNAKIASGLHDYK